MRRGKPLFLTLLFALATLLGLSSGEQIHRPVYASSKPQLEQENIVVDIYAEYDFTLLNYDSDVSYTWTSSDTTLATVVDGHMSCLGQVGDVVITVSNGKQSDKCNVSIKNQMINPSISVNDCLGFVNVETFPDIEVRYDGAFYPLTDYTLVSEDTSVATITSDGGIFGQSVGSATIVANGVWKGKKLKTKAFSVSINPESSVVLEQDTYDLYAVDDSSPVRKNYVEIKGDVYLRGQKVENALAVDLGPNPYLTSVGRIVSLSNSYNSEEIISYKVNVYYVEKPEVKAEATIVLHPNFDEKNSAAEVTETYKADIELDYVDFEGHENAYRYEITDKEINRNKVNPTWAHWETRIEFFETTTKNGVAAYDYMMEKGYTLLSFDMYYCGEKGVLIGAYGAPAKQYFYNNVRVNRSDMLIVNEHNVATNTLTNDQWYTVYIKISEVVLKSMTVGQAASSLYVSPCFVGDVTYFDNIRYYYDYSPLNDITIGFDVEERPLIEDENNPSKATSVNEMIEFSPTYVSYEFDEDKNLYKYDSSNALVFDREARSKIQAANLLNGNAVNHGYKYLAFDFVYTSGSPILYYFNNFTNAMQSLVLKPDTAKTNNFVSFYQNDRSVNTVQQNEVVTVVVRMDGRISDSVYLTSSVNSIFHIGNFAYFKDTTYVNDYSSKEPFIVVVDNIDTTFVGDIIDISKYVSVIYKGKAIRKPNISGFLFSSNIVEYYQGSQIIAVDKGELNIDFVVRVGSDYTTALINIRIKDNSYITLPNSSVSLYSGEKDYFEKEYDIQPLAVFNKELISAQSLNYELLDNSGTISLDKNHVTALKVGKEQIKISLPDNSDSVIFTVEVFDKYRNGSFEMVMTDATSPATYAQVNQTIYGVNSPFKYSSGVASWNNKLDISATNHTTTTVSKNNIINGHIDFITYQFLITDGTTLRAACVNKQGGHSNITLSVGNTINSSNNTNLIVRDLEGNTVSTLESNTWYQMVVDYSNFENEYKSGYPCHELVYLKGTCYIHDVRYYHDSIN